MATPPFPDSASAAAQIARYAPIPASSTESEVANETSQAEHRLDLAQFWDIPPGSRILEIGCGQGTCTAVLAEVVGAEGWVDAVDPGPPDYGAPYTLARSQAHISRSAIGDRIAWHNADPAAFLAETAETRKTWDAAVLVHCVWYFDRPEVLLQILQSLKGRVKRVLIAEYALQATAKSAVPHLLASIARATREAHDPSSTANIRCLLGPKQIVDAARIAGWSLGNTTTMVPRPALQDGEWETSAVTSARFVEDTKALDDAPRVMALLSSLREAVMASVEQLEKGEGVRTMDVWAASFS